MKTCVVRTFLIIQSTWRQTNQVNLMELNRYDMMHSRRDFCRQDHCVFAYFGYATSRQDDAFSKIPITKRKLLLTLNRNRRRRPRFNRRFNMPNKFKFLDVAVE